MTNQDIQKKQAFEIHTLVPSAANIYTGSDQFVPEIHGNRSLNVTNQFGDVMMDNKGKGRSDAGKKSHIW